MKPLTIVNCLVILIFTHGCSAQFIGKGCKAYESQTLKMNESREFYVIAINKCNPSGVILEKDNYYKFSVGYKDLEDGRITYDPDFPPEEKQPLTPKGFNSRNLGVFSKLILAIGQLCRPITTDNANWFELIGAVGQSNKYFSIYKSSESKEPFRADDSGELYGLVNDYPSRYGNNNGVFKVTITHVIGP
ncbi:MAG: hypothetical protein WCJ37_02785 [Syntrophus sp. (in: bacteria)]